jgi:hypothetical protein
MHVICHQVPFFNATFLLLRQRTKDLPEMLLQFVVKGFAPILRDKHYLILAIT